MPALRVQIAQVRKGNEPLYGGIHGIHALFQATAGSRKSVSERRTTAVRETVRNRISYVMHQHLSNAELAEEFAKVTSGEPSIIDWEQTNEQASSTILLREGCVGSAPVTVFKPSISPVTAVCNDESLRGTLELVPQVVRVQEKGCFAKVRSVLRALFIEDKVKVPVRLRVCSIPNPCIAEVAESGRL